MDNNCNHLSCVYKVPIFENLSLDQIADLNKILEHRHYDKGDIIYSPGETNNNLYILNKGIVKISRISEDGKEQITSILREGDFTNELALFNEIKAKEFATALEHTEICMINSKSLREHMEKHPQTAINIIETLSSRLNNSIDLIEGITIRSALWRLASTIYNEANDGIYVLDTTKRILASKLGMTQETLSRKFAELQDLKIIRFINNNKIEIIDSDKLINLL